MIFNFLIQLVVGAVLSFAGNLLQQAFGPKQQDRRTGTRGSRQTGGTVPKSFLVGTIGVPGKYEYGGEYGSSGGVPNVYAVDVLSFGDLPIDGFAGLYVNGAEATLATTGGVEQGYPVPEYNIAGGNKLWWRGYNGTQAAADSFLVSRFDSHPERPWTSAMIGRGVPYVTFTSFWHEEVWTKPFQDFMVVCRGLRLYDIRKDSTAGGSGSHRWGEPETYEFSDNSAVIIYNILRGIYYEGEHVWGGRRTAAQLPYSVWAAAMNACDEIVSLKGGGTEKRFRAGREIFFDELPGDVVKELLIGANARISYCTDGTVYVLVGVPNAADGAFTDTDVLATEPLGSFPFPKFDDVINGATASYIEPSQAWEMKDTDPYYRSDLEAQDGGERKPKGFQLPTTFSGTQAQRVLQAVIEEGRRFRKHVVALPPAYAQFRPLQVLAWTSDRYGYSGKLFLITARTRSPWGWVVLGLQEIDPADHSWNPATDERPIEFAPITSNRPAPQVVTGVWVEPMIGKDADDNERRGGYAVHWPATAVAVDVEQVSIVHRLKGESAIRWTGVINKPEIHLGSASVYESLIGGETFEVKVTYISASGRRIDASEWLEVTIPNIKLTPLDVQIDEIAAEVAESVAELTDWATHNTRETIERLRRNVLEDALASSNAYTDRQNIRREVISVTGQNRAEWKEDILVATGPDSAIVLRIEELQAEVFDPSTGLPATANALDALTVRVNTAGGGIESIAQNLTDLGVQVNDPSTGLPATAGALSALTTRVDTVGGGIEAIAQDLTDLNAQVNAPGTGLPATASALNLLAAEVYDPGTGLEAVGNAILALDSLVGNNASSALLRLESMAAPSGSSARAALSVGAGVTGTAASSALYLDARNDGTSEAVLVGGRVSLVAGPSGSKQNLLVVDGSAVWIDNARIRNLAAVNIAANSLDASVIDVDNIFAQTVDVAGTLRVGWTGSAGIRIQGGNNRILISD